MLRRTRRRWRRSEAGRGAARGRGHHDHASADEETHRLHLRRLGLAPRRVARGRRRRVRSLSRRGGALLEPRLMHRKHRTHYVHIPFVGFVALIIAVIGLTILLWSAERGADAHLNVKNPGDFNALLPSIVGLTQSSLEGGNAVPVPP